MLLPIFLPTKFHNLPHSAELNLVRLFKLPPDLFLVQNIYFHKILVPLSALHRNAV